MGKRIEVALLAAALAASWTPAAVLGQALDPVTPVRQPDTPRWMTAWSPLSRVGDGDRHLPRMEVGPDLLGAPAPRVGQLWSVGNPAALAHEARDAWGGLRVGGGGADGDYRRPLDADGVGVLQFSGLRWQPLGATGAVAGRIVADRTLADPGSLALPIYRHPSDPFVAVDTTTPPTRHVRLRMEGAYGWRAGGWGLGGALGLELTDDRTTRARAARLGRTAVPAAELGVLRTLPFAGMSVSVYGRWVGANELSRIALPPGVETQVFDLDGYGDPEPINAMGPSVVGRNVASTTLAMGVGVAGTVGQVTWAARMEREGIEQEHDEQRQTEEPPNSWDADRWRAGLDAVGRAGPVRVTLGLAYSTLNGDAFRRDLVGQGAIFRTDEEAFGARLDLRTAWADSAWHAGVVLWAEREARLRSDFLVSATSDISHWAPGVSAEVARRISARTALALGLGFGAYRPTSRVPDPASLGPVYRRYVAPELDLYGAQARMVSGSVTVKHALARGPALLVRGWLDRTEPTGQPTGLDAFDGSRTRWRVEMGAEWVSAR